MMGRHSSAEECDGAISLMKNSAKPRARCIAVDEETTREVRQLEKRRRHKGVLEVEEGPLGDVVPLECSALEEGSQRGCHRTVACDEFAVVARETQKTSERPKCPRLWPRLDGSHLLWIHGYTCVGDDMAEIANRFCTKETFGLFGEQPVLAQTLEHRLDMLQMLSPCRTMDQYIIKKMQRRTDGGTA